MLAVLATVVVGCAVAMSPPMPPPPGPPGVCNATFGEWQTSEKCVWPTETKAADLPDACKNLPPKPDKLPEVVYKFLEGKYNDYYNMWATETKARGMGGSCGMCGFKLKCRMQTTPPKDHFCPPKEKIFIYDKECQQEEPCELDLKDGGCEPPETSEVFHIITVFAALAKGKERKDIEVGHKLEKFFETMLGGPPDFAGKMKGKGKGKGPGMPPGLGDMGGVDLEKGLDQLKGLVEKSKGKGGEKEITDFVKTLLSDDMNADKLKDVMDTISQLFNTRRRRRRQAAVAELGENESYIAPSMNCVSNKEGSKCICCCNWHVPDRDTGKCVDVKDDLVAFVESIAPPMPELPGPLGDLAVSHPVEDLLKGGL